VTFTAAINFYVCRLIIIIFDGFETKNVVYYTGWRRPTWPIWYKGTERRKRWHRIAWTKGEFALCRTCAVL